MTRAGAEAKPPWQRVPRAVRERTAEMLAAPVARATRIYGGYAPSATFRLALADGRRAFFKGVYRLAPESPVRWVLDREERVYRRLGSFISPWAPDFYGAFEEGDWHVLLLEDLGPATVPPWSEVKARTACRAFGAFHRSTFGQPLPRWLPRVGVWATFGLGWQRLLDAPNGPAHLASLAGPRAAEAHAWIEAHLPALHDASRAFVRIRPPYALLHLDTRSDNVRVFPSAAVPLRLFDWPFACGGPPEFDCAAFAQSVACEGGPEPEALTRWYAAEQPIRGDVLAWSVAAVAGFFAANAWKPDLAGLPRLRSIQRCQLRASLAWASRLLALPEPAWLASIPVP